MDSHHPASAGRGTAPGRWARDALRRLNEGGPLSDVGLSVSSLFPTPAVRTAVALAGLGITLWVNLNALPPGGSGAGAWALVVIGVAGLAWLAWLVTDGGGATRPAVLAILGCAGGMASSFGSNGLIFVGVAAAGWALAFDLPIAALLAAVGPVGFTIGALAWDGAFPGRLLAVAAACLIGLLSSNGRRQMIQRAQQEAMIALAEERADVARREAELAGERNRLGRELHDVLAHTLGALSIQLTALDTLVATGTERTRLREEIERGHRLVGEGLDEARQAVRALREDNAPLPDQLRRLCVLHNAAFEQAGAEVPIAPEASLALYRVAQEALTNAAKHAPGAPITVSLAFEARETIVSVRNETSAAAARTRLAATGSGYGLQGMRERILLAGGRLQAGPDDGGWQVAARIPAPPEPRLAAQEHVR